MDFKMLSAICFSLDKSKILSSGNGLNLSSVSKSTLILYTSQSCLCCALQCCNRRDKKKGDGDSSCYACYLSHTVSCKEFSTEVLLIDNDMKLLFV